MPGPAVGGGGGAPSAARLLGGRLRDPDFQHAALRRGPRFTHLPALSGTTSGGWGSASAGQLPRPGRRAPPRRAEEGRETGSSALREVRRNMARASANVATWLPRVEAMEREWAERDTELSGCSECLATCGLQLIASQYRLEALDQELNRCLDDMSTSYDLAAAAEATGEVALRRATMDYVRGRQKDIITTRVSQHSGGAHQALPARSWSPRSCLTRRSLATSELV
mmetsp:Transcript_93829/g.201461  ORF Transcript_93829/g.201461 Transcript_93829/m.201461 type:complete len:226 (-) Transcript_93829:39-716(-)